MIGAGKYYEACTVARLATKAEGVIIIVYGGEHGDGFSAQLPAYIVERMPQVLRQVADQIEASSSPKLN